VVGLPSKDAKPVLGKGKIKLGWSISKVKERDSQPRCYKCLEIGHIAIKCHSKVDRSGCCIKCGKTRAFYAPKEDRSRGTTKQEAGGVLTPQKEP